MQEMDLGRGKYRKVIKRCLLPMEQRYQQMDSLLDDLHNQRGRYGMWAASALLLLTVIAAVAYQFTNLRRQAAEQRIQLKILNHEIIGFADPEAKRLCVSNWDTDGDGELSYEEAAAVDSLGKVFTGNKRLRSFDELEYFTGLKAIDTDAFRDCEALQSVRIPSVVRFIRGNAFRNTAIRSLTSYIREA